MRLTPVMLALLLALSPGAVAVQASAPTPTAHGQTVPSQTDAVRALDDGNTTNVMTLGTDPKRVAFDSPSLALGNALTMGHGEFRAELTAKSLEQQLETANSPEQKKQILTRYRYRIENRIISLKAKEQQATQAFSNGTISNSEYVRTLGSIDAEVADIRRLISTMRTRANSVPRFGMETEANTLKGKLVTVEGPIRDRIAATIRGEQSPTRVYVATGENGVVLSAIVNGEYVREIVRTDRRNPAASTKSSKIAARETVINQYPWAFNHSKFSGVDARYGSTHIYQVNLEHEQGELVAYYDGGTRSVFKEIQYKQLNGQTPLPTGPAVGNTSENVTLAVNRTYPGGPLRVKLTNATGDPVQGDVMVAGDSVGRTNADGVLWALSPVNQFRVSATYDFTTVNVTTTPVESTRP
ncbi:DUF7094 domain-containing protein [Halorussus caseinilyticus]|uniref:Uncharacterized protein n=1 Tax=Halorussus caseinilyticus TaxID=3034025 RepID=A0ABD5WMU8_9EURY|nr:hypothetical protein [Halorussus sp. DT72]